jgi:hypothetical protein
MNRYFFQRQRGHRSFVGGALHARCGTLAEKWHGQDADATSAFSVSSAFSAVNIFGLP